MIADLFTKAFDLRISDKLCSFISLYRSPNQSYDDFVSFLDTFELTLDNLARKNPFLMVVLGGFNAKSSNWYNRDIISNEGRKYEALTSQNGLHQEINESTPILNNSFDWEKALSNIDVDKMVYIFNQTIMNILCNFIPNETVLFDGRDPLWMNNEIKKIDS